MKTAARPGSRACAPKTGTVSFAGPPLCVVGNINRDIKVAGAPASPHLLRDGETSVSSIVETIGGGGANSACAAAALGADVRFLGKVGADLLGERLRLTLERQGVRAALARDPEQQTGSTVALGLSDGQRHFLSCLPNNDTLRLENLDLGALDGCGHLLRADVWFSEAMLEGGNRRLLAEARRRGLATSLDINFDPRWSGGNSREIRRRKLALRGILELVDLVHGNRRELCAFTDSPSLPTALKRLIEWGAQSVVVHLGAQGGGWYSGSRWMVEPPCRAVRPIHSTGCGDVLSVCMILLHTRTDLSPREKLRLSNRVVRDFMEGRLDLIPELAS